MILNVQVSNTAGLSPVSMVIGMLMLKLRFVNVPSNLAVLPSGIAPSMMLPSASKKFEYVSSVIIKPGATLPTVRTASVSITSLSSTILTLLYVRETGYVPSVAGAVIVFEITPLS